MTHAARSQLGAAALAGQVLIAGVGYQFLRDMSVGPAVVPLLRQLDWPHTVEIDDLSFGPIAVVQRFQARAELYKRVVFVSTVERGREPGRVYTYRWEGQLPGPDEIQACIGEAVAGVISLKNLLVITQYFGVLPPDVRVIEVEPLDTGWGAGFTGPVEAALPDLIAAVRQEALAEQHA